MTSPAAWAPAPGRSPSRERGLKLVTGRPTATRTVSLPSRERGLKPGCHAAGRPRHASLPSRERGLKLFSCWCVCVLCPSLPSVSIHAPARGATHVEVFRRRGIPVSIHAPARGATGIGHKHTNKRIVSIHAPARGATSYRWCAFASARGFNPRSREGSDRHLANRSTKPCQFQSTLPRGERQVWVDSAILRKAFQSTLPRGERPPAA